MADLDLDLDDFIVEGKKEVKKEDKENIVEDITDDTEEDIEEVIEVLDEPLEDIKVDDENIAGNNDELKDLKKENAKLLKRVEQLTAKKTITIDAHNVDDRKKLIDYMREGRVVSDIKGDKFILAVQRSKIYKNGAGPVHKIYLSDIKSAIVRRYYSDMMVMDKGKRDLLNTVITICHDGYEALSMIDEVTLDLLIKNGTIKNNKVVYTFMDIPSGTSVSIKGKDEEPTNDYIKAYIAKSKLNSTMGNKDDDLDDDLDDLDDSLEELDKELKEEGEEE